MRPDGGRAVPWELHDIGVDRLLRPTASSGWRVKAAGALGAAALVIAAHRVGRRSGVSTAECHATLPGDDLVPQPLWTSTRPRPFRHRRNGSGRGSSRWAIPRIAPAGTRRTGSIVCSGASTRAALSGCGPSFSTWRLVIAWRTAPTDPCSSRSWRSSPARRWCFTPRGTCSTRALGLVLLGVSPRPCKGGRDPADDQSARLVRPPVGAARCRSADRRRRLREREQHAPWNQAARGEHRTTRADRASEGGEVSTLAAITDYGVSAREWMRMATHHRLARPADNVGSMLGFRDGTRSRVFRETVVVGAPTADPVLLVIRFRLAFLDDLGPLHAGFRRECVIHSPLFAGFRGFRSKLWLEDENTRIYRGVYQWDGEKDAAGYAARMVGLLAPFSNRGTARSHVVPGLTRSDYLLDPDVTTGGASDGWWRLAHRATGRGRPEAAASRARGQPGYRRCANSCRMKSPARRRMRRVSRCSCVVTGTGLHPA